MSEPEVALRAVLEHPGDLATRLAYAGVLDARHDPLGEFIRLECQLMQSSGNDDALRLWDRRLSLLEAHADSWLAPLSRVAKSTRFERGLVEHVVLDLDTYLTHGAEIFGRFPIRSLAIRGVHGRMDELLASPWIDRIECLSLAEPKPSDYGNLSDDDVQELASSFRLHGLRSLDLGFNRQLGPRSVDSLVSSRWCNQLEFLGLGWTAVGDEGAAIIATTDRLGKLRRLDLSNASLGPTGAHELADSPTLSRLGLTEFNFSLNHDLDQEANARLLRSPVLARVGPVHLDGKVDAELVDAFVRSDSLGSMKALSFGNSWTIDTVSLRRLMRWPGLARLDSLTFILSALSDEQFGILARSPWLTDLKSLSLSETGVTEVGVERFCRTTTWRGLEELGIDRHHLTERSVHSILAAIWFPRLKSLDLHASYAIGDAGAAVLASYRGPTRLRRLVLSLAGMGDAGALALAEARYAPQLWTLGLLGNEAISPTTRELLKRRLGGRVHTERFGGREDWRNTPPPRV